MTDLRKLAWSCDERGRAKGECRNAHGCHCAEIADLQHASAAKDAEIARLEKLVYAPGMWSCPKCKFTLLQSTLSAADGTITARDNPGDKCRNCDSPLWRVSWKQDAMETFDTACRLRDEAKSKDVEIARLREAFDPDRIHAQTIEAMTDAWNDICADTGCHPLDIERKGRELTFSPRHWADQTATWLIVKLCGETESDEATLKEPSHG